MITAFKISAAVLLALGLGTSAFAGGHHGHGQNHGHHQSHYHGHQQAHHHHGHYHNGYYGGGYNQGGYYSQPYYGGYRPGFQLNIGTPYYGSGVYYQTVPSPYVSGVYYGR